MFRTLEIDIDRSTWPAPPNLPTFPAAFHTGASTESMSILGMLLMIGYLTAPTSLTGFSLSEFWAQLRYLGAFSSEPDLRLTSAYADLDAHQKTILSDDFGMGVPMLWLEDRLSLEEIVDGRYFIQYVAASIPAAARRTAKRGPNKSPDFVARDSSGVWHVVECKGTQSGTYTREGQISQGTLQKRSIVFPSSYAGQRLVGALSIALQGSTFSTSLQITDPPIESEEEPPFEISERDLLYAEDASIRSVVSKSLRLAGFEAAAETVSAPFGRSPADRPSTFRRREDLRRRIVEERDYLAREELDLMQERPELEELGAGYRGRRSIVDLPRPIIVDGQRVLQVQLSQGVNQDVLAELRERPTIETVIEDTDVGWRSAVGRTSISADDRRAVMKIGQLFRSEIALG